MSVTNVNDDIFADWKNARFIVADKMLTEDLTSKHIVVLADFKYWSQYSDELLEWCEQYNCEVKGMTVEIANDDTLLLFRLKWA